jgi:hypothetical protein
MKPKTTKNKIYIATGPLCWGRGKTPEEARQNCKKEKPKWIKAPKIEVWLCHPETIVTECGNLEWPRGHAPVLVTPKTNAKNR